MTDLATLGLSIDNRPLKDFSTELEKLPAKAGAAEAGTKRVTTATQQFAAEMQRSESIWKMAWRSFTEGVSAEWEAQRKLQQAAEETRRAHERLGAEIEKTKGISTGWAAALGTAIGNLASSGFRAGLSSLQDYSHGVVELTAKAADLQTSLDKVYAFGNVGRKFGLKPGDIAEGLEGFGSEMSKAARGASEIQKWLTANNSSLLDSKGYVVDYQTGLQRVADLVQNAHDKWEKIEILQAASLPTTSEWIRLMEQGGDALRRALEQYGAMSVEQRKLADQAFEFERQWKVVSDSVREHFVANIGSMSDKLASLASGAALVVKAITLPGQAFRSAVGLSEVPGMNLSGSLEELAERLRSNDQKSQEANSWRNTRLTEKQGGMGPDMNDGAGGRFGRGTASRDPSRGLTVRPPEGGGRGASDARDDYENMTRSIENQTRRLEEQAATFEKSAREVAHYRAEQELTTAAQRAGRDDTPALRADIERLATAYADAADKIEQMRQKSQQFKEMQGFFGNELVTVLDRATERGGDLTKVFDDLTSALKRAVIQAAILGQGPLAGLFGTAAPAGSNSAGGLFGWLTNGAKGWFGGGGAEVQGPPMPSWMAQQAHTGGLVGWDRLEGRYVHPAYFDDAPRFARGGIAGLGPDEIPIIAHRNEEILRRDDPRHRWNSSGGDTSRGPDEVHYHDYAGAGVKQQTSEKPDGGRRTDVIIGEMVAGGMKSPQGQAALRGYGVRPPVLQA